MSTSAADPLATRSLPGHIWEKIPADWLTLDNQLQDYLENSINREISPWKEFRWLTESNSGIAILSVLLLAFFCFTHFQELKDLKLKIKSKSAKIKLSLFILGLGVSDLVAMRLKIFFGRFKPHVNYYHPDYLPALSFPSSHAFNSAFLFSLLFYVQAKPLRGNQKIFYTFLFVCILIIVLSRVLLGQHYPLDIFVGLLLGTLLAKIYAYLFKIISKESDS